MKSLISDLFENQEDCQEKLPKLFPTMFLLGNPDHTFLKDPRRRYCKRRKGRLCSLDLLCNSQSYDGSFDASELATSGDLSSFFIKPEKDAISESLMHSLRQLAVESLDVAEWTSSIQMSGAKKVVPERIYSMVLHPRSDKLMVIIS